MLSSQKLIRNHLYLVWKNPVNHSNYIIGSLYRDEEYIFEYSADFKKELINNNVEVLHAFPEVDKIYTSKELFPSFASRLPDRKRRDIRMILEKYNLSEFDEFELLRSGGGRLPIDTYSFVDPIFPDDETVERDFYIMGLRHYAYCNGKSCDRAVDVYVSDCVSLKREPSNEYDSYAVQIYKGSKLLGYIPRYYSEAVSKRLNKGMSYECRIVEINPNDNCDECIKVKLTMPRKE